MGLAAGTHGRRGVSVSEPGGDSTHHGGWASGLRFKNALINPIGFTGGSNSGRTPALDECDEFVRVKHTRVVRIRKYLGNDDHWRSYAVRVTGYPSSEV